MIFFQFRKALKQNIQYTWVLAKSSFHPVKKKIIYIDISEIAINRYLYIFLKMFHLQGYTIYLPRDKRIANVLGKKKGEFIYTSWLLSERIVKFKSILSGNTNVLSAEKLSNKYFVDSVSPKNYHVPMGLYPAYYKDLRVFGQIEIDQKRKSSIFMSGNIDPQYYDQISASSNFNVLSRKVVADFLSRQKYFLDVSSMNELHNYLQSEEDKKVIIIDTFKKFRIEFATLPNILKKFNFYLALPGIIIPQSHNLTEAMACGCIPVLQEAYGKLMKPALSHGKNAIFYQDLNNLNKACLDLFGLDNKEILRMRKQVLHYYEKNMSPKAIVQNVEEGNFDKIFIQAEHLSLK